MWPSVHNMIYTDFLPPDRGKTLIKFDLFPTNLVLLKGPNN